MRQSPPAPPGPRVPDRPAAVPAGWGGAWWRRVDAGTGGLLPDLALYLLSAAFAVATWRWSTLPAHRAWGGPATAGYLIAAAATLVLALARAGTPARRAAVLAVAWLGSVAVPLLAQAVQRAAGRPDRAQEEVVVVERAGARLLEAGTPYLDRAAIAALHGPDRLLAYLPYQPGMAVFGLPRALAGVAWWTDARVWFAVATLACLGAAARLARRDPAGDPALVRALQLVSVLPICALTLATGGDDLPVLALCLLSLVLAARGRAAAAGLAVGAAAAMKLFAVPVVLVLAAWALASGGPRRLLRYLPGALGLPLLALSPAVLRDPSAVLENLVRYPMGEGLVMTTARSPLPGHLLAGAVPGGRAIDLGLLLATGVALAVWLLRRPPRRAARAAAVCAVGLLAALLLLPSTRFGYLLYPIGYAAWIPVLRQADDR